MSENTPDTAMDTSDMSTDMTNGESEPSMEDILASIRQIIADDQTDELIAFDDVPDAAPTSLDIVSDSTFVSEPIAVQNSGIALEIVADSPVAPLPDTPLSNVVEEDTDILDLINFVDESIGGGEAAESAAAQGEGPKNITPESFDEFEDLIVSPSSASIVDMPSAPVESALPETFSEEANSVAFDEALDLIVSADATDFVTTSLSADLPGVPETGDEAARELEVTSELEVRRAVSDDAASLEEMFEDLVVEPVETAIDTASLAGVNESQNDEFEDLILEADDLMIPEISGTATSFENTVEVQSTEPSSPLSPAPEIETSFDNSDLDDLDLVFVEPDDPNFPDVFKSDADAIETAPVFEATLPSKDIADDDIDITSASEGNVMRVKPDEDMDLVKSLLADLMDEPAADMSNLSASDITGPESTASKPVTLLVEPDTNFLDDAFLSDDEGEVAEPEDILDSVADEADAVSDETNILDDVLEKSIEQEVAIHEEMEALQQDPQSAPAAVDAVEDNSSDLELVSSDDENSLSAIAAEAEKLSALRLLVQEDEVEAITPSIDTVSLEAVGVESKLSLVSKTGAGLAVVGAGAVAFLNAKSASTDVVETVSPDVETSNNEGGVDTVPQTPEQIDQLGDDHQQPIPKTPTPKISEETETMAQAAKPETIVDEGTHRVSSDAFASLTSAVKEKAEMEERGPAIGDLVQDALRPMLKEWLDKNLKGIVERAVAKEVKRISSGK